MTDPVRQTWRLPRNPSLLGDLTGHGQSNIFSPTSSNENTASYTFFCGRAGINNTAPIKGSCSKKQTTADTASNAVRTSLIHRISVHLVILMVVFIVKSVENRLLYLKFLSKIDNSQSKVRPQRFLVELIP